MSAVTIILIVLVVLLVAGLPHWYGPAYGGFGYYPSGIISVLLVILLVPLLFGVIR